MTEGLTLNKIKYYKKYTSFYEFVIQGYLVVKDHVDALVVSKAQSLVEVLNHRQSHG